MVVLWRGSGVLDHPRPMKNVMKYLYRIVKYIYYFIITFYTKIWIPYSQKIVEIPPLLIMYLLQYKIFINYVNYIYLIKM